MHYSEAANVIRRFPNGLSFCDIGKTITFRSYLRATFQLICNLKSFGSSVQTVAFYRCLKPFSFTKTVCTRTKHIIDQFY